MRNSLCIAVFPEFIAREKPGRWGLAVKEEAQGVVRPAAQRGHGPARLDGQAPLATVAGLAMKRGKTDDRLTAPDERRTNAACERYMRAAGTPNGWEVKRVARYRRFGQADLAQPVRQLCGAPSTARRGGRKPIPGVRHRCPVVVESGTAKKGAKPPRLQQPAFGKTQDVATGDDQVIQQFDVHQR